MVAIPTKIENPLITIVSNLSLMSSSPITDNKNSTPLKIKNDYLLYFLYLVSLLVIIFF